MSKELKTHTFPNGDVLTLDAVSTYVGLHGLTVFTVLYGSKDGDEFRGIGSEQFMSESEAIEAFDNRMASADPSKPTREHGGFHEIVLDAFGRYFGERSLRQEHLPNDWSKFFGHVKDTTIAHDKIYYDGDKVHEALDGLNTVSGQHSDGRADVMVELPAWKVLEMLTAITALAMIVRQQNEPRLRIAA